MKAGPRILAALFPLLFTATGCFFTDEMGLPPANAVREDEVGRRLQFVAADGWFAGAYAYSRARSTPTISINLGTYDDLLPTYAIPLSAEYAGYQSQTTFYTGPSVKLCMFTARNYAFSTAALTLETLDLQQQISDLAGNPNVTQEAVNELEFTLVLSSFMAAAAADAGCREELVRTGRVVELDRGRL